MPEYRLYLVAPEGHFQSSIALPSCTDDAGAIETAKQLSDGHDIELWSLDPLDAIRRARDTPIWKLEPSFRCRSCGTRRYKPSVRMIKLTEERADYAL